MKILIDFNLKKGQWIYVYRLMDSGTQTTNNKQLTNYQKKDF
jgi:hypothetical protein